MKMHRKRSKRVQARYYRHHFSKRVLRWGWACRKEASKEQRQKRKERLNSSDCWHCFKRKYIPVFQHNDTKRDHNNIVGGIVPGREKTIKTH